MAANGDTTCVWSGRLRRGVQLDKAKQELTSIAQAKISEFPRPPGASLEDGFIVNSLQADLTRAVRPALFAIIGAVILLLMIACVNVTNLLLARGVARRDELAVRAALGASRMRLIRQSLIETLLLSTVGGVLGILLAYAAVEAVVLLSPPELPRAFAIKLDGTALVFALGLTTLIGLTIGAIPALNWSKERPVRQNSARLDAYRWWTSIRPQNARRRSSCSGVDTPRPRRITSAQPAEPVRCAFGI